MAKDAECLHADYEDPDQTARMRRLIWVLGGLCQKAYDFPRLGSYMLFSCTSSFGEDELCFHIIKATNVSIMLKPFCPYGPYI